MNKTILFIGAYLMSSLAVITSLIEGCSAGARPYASAAIVLLFFALASK